MNIGRMDRRITVMVTSMIDDGYGGTIPGGTVALGTFWANVRQLSGREFIGAEAVQAERKAVFTVHWVDGLDTTATVEWDGATWNIREVREVGRREALELHCTSE
ncbi:phage head closure protein [Rhodospira trueperi]|uniref:Phage head-tail adaptor, putative, SPP1 family n=1 Tax=Rhodospira trueperi TaxID=69960 RepID=A0A1G6X1A2_9PROT|nr:phage head closure protein [Rhodospira trueperi]SDD71982.1 phage head-tail adaptor, putative, SPP1 family [Rhodospira trueperi]